MHEKEYAVKVNKPIKSNFITRMGKGVKIEDGPVFTLENGITKRAEVTETGPKSFRIVLTEGKKHQIRRMVTALGYEVSDLERIRIMNVEIGGLKVGQFRKLAGSELAGFLSGIGLS
jgi:23S rRNA pseudouridine2604 synthase